jgi:hypothetical protein
MMAAIRKVREKWRIRRERIRRLNAARALHHEDTPPGGGQGQSW